MALSGELTLEGAMDLS